jgi:prepilin-type N-terminal cleavage/methylation domain-containing protein
MKKLNSQSGFTVIELMISTAIFSIVLLICAFAIIHVGKMYYKGVITNRTQDTSRRLIDDIASAIQFGAATDNPNLFYRTGAATYGGVNVESICLGNIRYSYSRNHYLGEINHIVWRDQVSASGCVPRNVTLATPSADGQEMLGENMRLPSGITIAVTGQLWSVSSLVSYGNDAALFQPTSGYTICRGVNAGGQFCAVSSLSTYVTKRL